MRVMNKVSSAAPVKRGKEREKPKPKKKTVIRKVWLSESFLEFLFCSSNTEVG